MDARLRALLDRAMRRFSPTDAAFEGLRLTRERPRAVLAWAACYLIFSYLIGVVADLTLGPQSKALLADLQRANSDPAAFWPAAQKMAPFFLAGLPLSLVFQAIFTSAVYRAVLSPEEARRGYLRLGMDEVRIMALNVIMSVIWGLTLFGVLMVSVFTAVSLGAAAAPALVLVGDILTMVAFGAAIVILVRLSLAGPLTFNEHRLRVFESWALTRGSFWRLLGAYILAFAMGAVVLVLMGLILFVVASVLLQLNGGGVAALSAPSPGPLVVVLAFVWQVASVLIFTCFYVVLKAPAAQAYKDLTITP
jgi:hypothetical protein